MTTSFLTSNETLTGTALSPPVAKGNKMRSGGPIAQTVSPNLDSRTVEDSRKFNMSLTPDKHHLYLSSK